MDPKMLADVLERREQGQLWEQKIRNEGSESVRLAYASGGTVVIEPGASVWVLTTIRMVGGQAQTVLLPLGWLPPASR